MLRRWAPRGRGWGWGAAKSSNSTNNNRNINNNNDNDIKDKDNNGTSTKSSWLSYLGNTTVRRTWAAAECVAVMAGVWVLWREPEGMGMESWRERFGAVFGRVVVFWW